MTHFLHSLAACRAWIPGNKQRSQVPQPHLLQVGVRQSGTDLILRQSESSVIELGTIRVNRDKDENAKG